MIDDPIAYIERMCPELAVQLRLYVKGIRPTVIEELSQANYKVMIGDTPY